MKLTALAGGRHKAPLRALPAMDLPFLVLVLTLVGFGLVMLGSASGAVALYRRGDAFAIRMAASKPICKLKKSLIQENTT